MNHDNQRRLQQLKEMEKKVRNDTIECVLDELPAGNDKLDDFLNTQQFEDIIDIYIPTKNYAFVAEKVLDAFYGLHNYESEVDV